ncbi:hypothetical protein ACYCJX_05390 [Staphylococcus borealis]|uniref:Uncharacterized protein n=1 Tax=Staphylococcus haemolyticus TaxID=1283 RepID=A0A1B1UY78_STAHA|nr:MULTISPECIES: hypothetical protein [Staphylococcus]ANW08036.1 hypothetical protein [Staphylococcus haemolyticus]MCD9075899.1 hypothetical protein [Staphylococcus haemolyticus]MDM7881417.1 hypothetical protein [Staphylococcus borealis]UII02116.1 hypothetical protein DENEGGJD_00086 [Staphylococcus haemolyticus]HDJ7544294.1 hypothetical protein [Staphylococcus aureus]
MSQKLDEINKEIEEELLQSKQDENNENNSNKSNMNKPRAIFLCLVLLMGLISFIRLFM